MSRITISIDGRELQANPGANVLETALAHGIYIPHLCNDPELKPQGCCRLCLVSVRGARGFPAACTAQVTDGMVVITAGAELEQVRRDALELLLAEHPMDCLCCMKNQRCDLQAAAAHIGGLERTLRRVWTSGRGIEHTPCFRLERDYCVLCQKCVRTCDEIAEKHLLAVVNRGAHSQIATFENRELMAAACASCQECVKRCPTAALQPLPR